MAPLRALLALPALAALLSLVSSSPTLPAGSKQFDVHARTAPGRLAQREALSQTLTRRNSGKNSTTCPIPTDIPVRASKPSPFLGLSDAEFSSVVDWLFQPEQNLNLTSVSNENLTQTDNYIWMIEALHPNKTGILAYLDGNATSPTRYARVVINEGGKEVPDSTDYYVSSLPSAVYALFYRLEEPRPTYISFYRLDLCPLTTRPLSKLWITSTLVPPAFHLMLASRMDLVALPLIP